MYNRKIVIYLLLILTIVGCKPKKKVEIEDCNENCVRLSELQTKTDYYSPVNLYNDLNSSDLIGVILNGESIQLNYGQSYLIEESGFYELELDYSGDDDREILFTLKTPERENAEWGIEVWVPDMFTTELVSGEDVDMIYPRQYIEGIGIPFIFYVYEGEHLSNIYCDAQHTGSESDFYIKRGVGSLNLAAASVDNSPFFTVGGKVMEVSTTKTTKIDIELSGELTDDVVIPENSVVAITGDLYFPPDISITVHAGSLILVDEAVDITNDGPVEFLGQKDDPIFVTCRDKEKYWGGFISKGTSGNISAKYTIFTQSGYHAGGSYAWGHAGRQALFYTEGSVLTIDNCYMLDHIGQIFYPLNSILELESILVQRAKTGGQFVSTVASISNSIFTDFPDDSQNYRDEDNDALYVNGSDIMIDNCTFMFAKDDGLDSGSNFRGTINVTDSHFEACFHEGAAVSSPGDAVNSNVFTNCVFYNCGQGIELGFSSPNHHVVAEDCKFLNNGIGIRYGDNYEWSSVNGTMFIKNSVSLYNTKDVWNMVHGLWSPKLENLQFENVLISKYTEQYPDLQVIQE